MMRIAQLVFGVGFAAWGLYETYKYQDKNIFRYNHGLAFFLAGIIYILAV